VKRVLTAAILIPIVVLALFRAPLWLFTLLVLGVALLAAREYFDIAEKTGFRPMREWGYLVLVLTATIGLLSDWSSPWVSFYAQLATRVAIVVGISVIFLWPFLLLATSIRRDPLSGSLGDASSSLLMIAYIGLPLTILAMLRSTAHGVVFLLFLMLLVWCGDIAAYYVGRVLGKHKLAPRISPGKTWEGAIASVIGAVIVGLLLFHYINPIADVFRGAHLLVESASTSFARVPGASRAFPIAPVWFVIVLAVCVNIAAQLGDLVESAMKRGAGMKDSGTLLPGHGGVLDRIDALLFALPVGLLFYAFGMSRYLYVG
jgi:phosphatidate cytidylyltransferase